MANKGELDFYRSIDGYPGYRVGRDGSVWSCLKRTGLGRGKGSAMRVSSEWHRLAQWPAKANNKRAMVRFHFRPFAIGRLVLTAFVGPCPPGMVCCHFPDKNPNNCSLDNLRWDTRKANMFDMRSHGTHQAGELNKRSKLTASQVSEIRNAPAGRRVANELAAVFGVQPRQIRRIRTGFSWTAHNGASL